VAQTKLDIWNQALDRIGETEEIENENEDRVAAEVCGRHYDSCITEALSFASFPWPFATGQAPLVPLVGVARIGWQYAYAYPPNCLVPRALLAKGGTRYALTLPSGRKRYALQANDAGDALILLTDQGPTDFDVLEYTRGDVSEVLYPPAFQSALVWRLAAELAVALVKTDQGRALYERIMHPVQGDFIQALRVAAADSLNAQQNDAPSDVDGEYLAARR
jgi:hypothetical protein